MRSKFMKYVALCFLLFGIFTFVMEQSIEVGRFHHAKEDYLLEASLLAYNPAIHQQQNMAVKQKFSLLNNAQFYDFLARSHQVQKTNTLGKVLGKINDQIDITPDEQKTQRRLVREKVPCRLLDRKNRGIIPESQDVFREYKHQFNNSLKLTVTEPQLANIWQPLTCDLATK